MGILGSFFPGKEASKSRRSKVIFERVKNPRTKPATTETALRQGREFEKDLERFLLRFIVISLVTRISIHRHGEPRHRRRTVILGIGKVDGRRKKLQVVFPWLEGEIPRFGHSTLSK